jgi:UDP-N-acetyl-D-mannosaminuronic acid transferase (WecB/TagA/CpsF family)
MVNIGGGVQEPLGYYLRQNLSYRPSIICVGAAIGFITGLQAGIPVWADALLLGWFFRCLHAPRAFIPRIWKGFRLVPILAQYRERSVAG